MPISRLQLGLTGAALAVLLVAMPARADQQDDLVLASAEGHGPLVVSLLRQNVDINGPDRSGLTALMSAARKGHMETVQLLLNHGASVTVRDWKGRNALQHAQEHGHAGVVELLKHQQAFATAYLGVLGRSGKHPIWGGTLTVAYTPAGTTHLSYTKPGLTLSMATMVARTLAGPGLDYGAAVLEDGWVTFPPEGTAGARVKAKIKSWGYKAQQVEVWLQ